MGKQGFGPFHLEKHEKHEFPVVGNIAHQFGDTVEMGAQIAQRVDNRHFAGNRFVGAVERLFYQCGDDVRLVAKMPIHGSFGKVDAFGYLVKGCFGITFS